MQIDNTIIALILVLGFSLILFVQLRSTKSSSDTTLVEWLKTMHGTLQDNSRQLNERLDKSATVIREVGIEVGKMSEIGRNMKDLQDILKGQKVRGNIGEQILKDQISQAFPKASFHLQYQFTTGDTVDAAIKTDGGMLPIDSKFPMENWRKMNKSQSEEERKVFKKEFERDVKKHIEDISRKYILPNEGTMDFALMYIPAEAIFNDMSESNDLLDFARKLRVYPVSPNTLYLNLQTILLSFEGKKIESKSKEVFRLLRALQIDYEKVQESMGVLGKHITNASSQFINVSTSFEKIGNKLDTTKSLEKEVVEKISKGGEVNE
jgi:DNA recombination protein RmuC